AARLAAAVERRAFVCLSARQSELSRGVWSDGFGDDQLVHQLVWNRLVEREAHRALARVIAAQLIGEGIHGRSIQGAVALGCAERHEADAQLVRRQSVAYEFGRRGAGGTDG